MAEEALTLPAMDVGGEHGSTNLHGPTSSSSSCTMPGSERESQRRMRAQQPLGNVVLLERPVRPETFVSTVQAALRSRRRQYQMRDHSSNANHAPKKHFVKSEKLAVAGRLAAKHLT